MIGHHTWLHGLCMVQFQGVVFTKTAVETGPPGTVQHSSWALPEMDFETKMQIVYLRSKESIIRELGNDTEKRRQ